MVGADPSSPTLRNKRVHDTSQKPLRGERAERFYELCRAIVNRWGYVQHPPRVSGTSRPSSGEKASVTPESKGFHFDAELFEMLDVVRKY